LIVLEKGSTKISFVGHSLPLTVTARPEFQIVNPVIRAIAVYVVDCFIRAERPT
jgi:hypothetical protein